MFSYFFLFLLQNIDCGYSLEPPHGGGVEAFLTNTHNLCFGAKIRKIAVPLHTPVAETAVWPIPFLINMLNALKVSRFYSYLLLLQLVLCRVAVLKSLPLHSADYIFLSVL